MDVGKIRSRKHTNSRKGRDIDTVDFDWGDMIAPQNRVFTSSITNPYVIHQTDHSPISDEVEIDTEDIELSDLDTVEKLDDLEILRRSSLAARDLKFRIATDFSNESKTAINQIIEYVHWLKQNMEILSKRLGQTDSDNKNEERNLTTSDTSSDTMSEDKSHAIGRNSYKFCDFGHSCTFNYSLEYKRDCYSQHYVYPLILSDIQNLIDHILTEDDGISSDLQVKEVVTSINTVTYVINHMYNELSDLKKNNQIGYTYYTDGKLRHKCVTKNSKRRHRKKKI